MQFRKFIFCLAVSASLILAGCTAPASPTAEPTTEPAAPAPTGELDGTAWILNTLNGMAPLSNIQVTLNFSAGQANGSDGCNSFGGAYTVASGGKLSFDQNMVSTMMACEEDVMTQASAYTAALLKSAGYRLDGGSLNLLDEAGNTLAVFNAQSTSLAGSSWTVTSYNNGKEAVVSVLPDTTLTLEFGTDGKISGSAGCNNYFASFEAADSSLKIGMPGSTRMACAEPAGIMEQENQFLAALQTASTYTLDGGKLELRTETGALAVSLIAAAK